MLATAASVVRSVTRRSDTDTGDAGSARITSPSANSSVLPSACTTGNTHMDFFVTVL